MYLMERSSASNSTIYSIVRGGGGFPALGLGSVFTEGVLDPTAGMPQFSLIVFMLHELQLICSLS